MQTNTIVPELFELAQSIFGLNADEPDPNVGILELGLDSLMIIKLSQEIERRWSVGLEASWFISAMPSLTTLADEVANLCSRSSPLPKTVEATRPAPAPRVALSPESCSIDARSAEPARKQPPPVPGNLSSIVTEPQKTGPPKKVV